MMFTRVLIVCCMAYVMRSDEDKEAKFPSRTWVTLLKNSNFDNTTQLGTGTPDKPWLIFFFSRWCPSCRRIIPIWERIEKKYRGKIHVAAVNGEGNLGIRDRFAIYKYPTTIYFSTNNRMYYYEDLYTDELLEKFIDTEAWKKQEAYDIPTEISYVKVYYNKFTSPVMIPIAIVVFFIGLVIFIFIQDRKYEKVKYAEARRIKQNLIDREQVQLKGTDEATTFIKEPKKAAEIYETSLGSVYFSNATSDEHHNNNNREGEIELTNI